MDDIENPTPAQIQQLRYALGMTQVGFGQWLRSSARTVQQWEAGKHTMPSAIWELALLKSGRAPLVIAPAIAPSVASQVARTTDAHADLL